MKNIIALSLMALSLNSFAGVTRMVAVGECTNTVAKTFSVEAQKADLLRCAESRAHTLLSRKCEGRGTAWLLESEIAKRDFQSAVTPAGRTMTVSAMAVGRCEF